MNAHPIIGNPNNPLLIYLHGWSEEGASAKPWLKAIGEQYHCSFPQLPGTGDIPYRPLGPTLRDFAGWLLKEIDQRFPNRTFHLMGNSLGGMIAQELALLAPERVTTLILLVTSCYFQDPDRPLSQQVLNDLLQYQNIPDAREFVISMIKNYVIPQNVERFTAAYRALEVTPFPDRRALRDRWNAVTLHNTHNRLPKLTMPALVMSGDQDVLLPPNHGEYLASLLPSATFNLIPNSGHAFGLDAPGFVAREVMEFLEKH
ncbi:MAG: alpha/beta hydrolase [Deltaproteobacteria bacterium]|nr:alpha/beta hydrolase [Deltaproteobacteria bacterium]